MRRLQSDGLVETYLVESPAGPPPFTSILMRPSRLVSSRELYTFVSFLTIVFIQAKAGGRTLAAMDCD